MGLDLESLQVLLLLCYCSLMHADRPLHAYSSLIYVLA